MIWVCIIPFPETDRFNPWYWKCWILDTGYWAWFIECKTSHFFIDTRPHPLFRHPRLAAEGGVARRQLICPLIAIELCKKAAKTNEKFGMFWVIPCPMWTVIVKFDYVTFSLVWGRSQWRSQGGTGGTCPPITCRGTPYYRHFAFVAFFLQKISVLSYLPNEVAEIRGEYWHWGGDTLRS